MSWSFTGLGVSYYLVRGSTWGQILLSQSKAMKIKELNNLLLCFVEIQFYDLLIRWCHESCFYESHFFPTKFATKKYNHNDLFLSKKPKQFMKKQ